MNWFAVSVFVFLLAVIVGGGYYLFFSPTPGIEVIAPLPLASAEDLAQAKLDVAGILNNPVLKGLRQYGSAPGVGSVGKRNPFAP